MNRSWFLSLSPPSLSCSLPLSLLLSPPLSLFLPERWNSKRFHYLVVSTTWLATESPGNWATLPLMDLFFSKSMSFAVLQHPFLYKHKTTHSGPLCKMGLILLGVRRVLQTNIMDDNQLCNPQCTDLFWNTGMCKYNKTAFLIKEEVINLMISSPCVLFPAAIPHNTTLLSPFSVY